MDTVKQDSNPEEASALAAWKFSGAVLVNPSEAVRRPILICGLTRGGTSFAASVFHHLGVPFSRAAGITGVGVYARRYFGG